MLLLTHLCLLYPNMELVMSSIIIVHIYPHEEGISTKASVCSSSSTSTATLWVVTFYGKASFGFLPVPDIGTGASCDHSEHTVPWKRAKSLSSSSDSFLRRALISLVFQGFHHASGDKLSKKMGFFFLIEAAIANKVKHIIQSVLFKTCTSLFCMTNLYGCPHARRLKTLNWGLK